MKMWGRFLANKEKSGRLFWTLFKSTFVLSAFTFGGGYVIVPLMQKKFVEELKWIEADEMLDLVALGQSAPGAIAVNTSILIGYRMAGFWGFGDGFRDSYAAAYHHAHFLFLHEFP